MAIQSKLLTARKNEMDNYMKRLATFSMWNGLIKKKKLASFGFFYSGLRDIVICHGCELQLEQWKCSDDPLVEHLKFNIECNLIPQDSIISYVIQPVEGIQYPRYTNSTTRIESFSNYPIPCNNDEINLLAAAGFFYSGQWDWLFCFRCGVGLKNWSKRENPFEIHKRFFPDCVHVADVPKKPEYWCTITDTKKITREDRQEYIEEIDVKDPIFRANKFNVLKPEFN